MLLHLGTGAWLYSTSMSIGFLHKLRTEIRTQPNRSPNRCADKESSK